MPKKGSSKDMPKSEGKSSGSKNATKTESSVNALTDSAGLCYNVNIVGNATRDAFRSREQDDYHVRPSAKVAITATLEKLTCVFLDGVTSKTKVGNDGLRTVHRNVLWDVVRQTPELLGYFDRAISTYDPQNATAWKSQPIDEKDYTRLTKRYSKVNLTPRAKLLLGHLLGYIFNDITLTIHSFLSYSKKKTVDVRVVQFVINQQIRTGLAGVLLKEVERAVDALPKDVSGDVDKVVENEGSDDEGADGADEGADDEGADDEGADDEGADDEGADGADA